MKEYLIQEGYPADRIIEIQIFDYLYNSSVLKPFNACVNIAGNLDPEKAAYLVVHILPLQ